MAIQLQLNGFDNLYLCQYCGQNVPVIFKDRRWKLCPQCWQEIILPTNPRNQVMPNESELAARDKYWGWYGQMERRYPTKQVWHAPAKVIRLSTSDNLYPICKCGQLRKPYSFNVGRESPGLFGGPYFQYCPVCEAKRTVESIFKMKDYTHPGLDDEEILDKLYLVFPECFSCKVLPDYWFELKFNEVK